MALFTTLLAQGATSYRLGFCDGKVTTDGVTVEGTVDIEAAITLTPADLARFSGDSFVGVNAGLTTKLNANTLTVWVRESLDGANLAESTISITTSQKPRDGWNNVRFESPLEIDPSATYYVGYTLHQTRTSSLVAYSSVAHPGASMLRVADGEWKETDCGAFCIEALLEGDNLPGNDLTLVSASLCDYSYIVAGREFTVAYEVRNVGVETIYSYELTVSVPGTDISYSRTMTGTMAYGIARSGRETLILPGLEASAGVEIEVSVSKPNGLEEETPADNSVTIGGIPVLATVFPRTLLLEEFTTEKCSNCPGAAQTLHDMLEGFTDEERARLAIVGHHEGYYTDDFTLPCDKPYTWFYNNYNSNGALITYAPAFMLDRTQAYDDAPTPVFMNLPVVSFSEKLAEAREVPALYSISFEGTHDTDSRTVNLKVSGERVLDVMENPRVTVYLVEDNVMATGNGLGQAGSLGREYYHQHLVRAYNATWGEAPEWDGDSYTYSCTLEYPEVCKTDDMQVVAFISNYDEDNPVNCEVGNTAWSSFAGLTPLGVAQVGAADDAATMLYDLSGRRVSALDPAPGIYVLRSGGETRKVLVR